MSERTFSAKHNETYQVLRRAPPKRRRTSRLRTAVSLFALIIILSGIIIYGLRQDEVRISHIEVVVPSDIYSLDNEERLALIKSIAERTITGNYFGIVPRDSIFFFPEGEIRKNILTADNFIAAVSISRNNFSTIIIETDIRVPIARWCGLSPAQVEDYQCHFFDSGGFIFATFSPIMPTINTFRLYSPIVGNVLEPLGATISNIDRISVVFDFARNIANLGSHVESIVVRDGEVDNLLSSGTRITYVLGNEQNAFTALASVKDNIDLNLADGSIEYVDLRFGDKVYMKRK